jgi:hypothetical protein
VDKKKPIPFENGLAFSPKFLWNFQYPRRVGYTLPKMRKNSKLDEREEIAFCNSGKSSEGLGRKSIGGR